MTGNQALKEMGLEVKPKQELMEVTIGNVKGFIRACKKITSVVDAKSTMPILTHFLFEVNNESSLIRGTDLDTELEINITELVEVHSHGAICLPARQFFNILKGKTGPINIKVSENNWIHIGPMRVMGLPSDDFPWPQEQKKLQYKTNISGLGNRIDKVRYASGLSDTRYMLNGVLLDFEKGKIVATDGHRLSIVPGVTLPSKKVQGKKGGEVDRKKVINNRTSHLLQSFKDADFQINFNTAHIWFMYDRYKITSRVCEGNYPNYEQTIPLNNPHTATVHKDTFIQKLNEAMEIVKTRNKIVTLTFNGNIEICAINPDIGEYRDSVAVEYNGPELSIGLNAQYMLDYLLHVGAESIMINLKDVPLTPTIWRTDNQNDAMSVIMPTRL